MNFLAAFCIKNLALTKYSRAMKIPKYTFNQISKRYKNSCANAFSDIKVPPDKKCPRPCEPVKAVRRTLLQRFFDLKILDGGTNFGFPFRRVECAHDPLRPAKKKDDKVTIKETKGVVVKSVKTDKRVDPDINSPPIPPGVQVTLLGSDTPVGQHLALLLKQSKCIKRLCLFDPKQFRGGARDAYNVTADLNIINTNCKVRAFHYCQAELDRSLQSTDIAVILESGYVDPCCNYMDRFYFQAPMVKAYAEAITRECPRAMVIVAATPVDCLLPVASEVFKSMGWYDPCRLLGSMAVPEMRASSMTATALSLDPKCTRILCIGGSEGYALLPLFSKAVEYFDFCDDYAASLTQSVRYASQCISRSQFNCCLPESHLSEAHALAKLTHNVAHALLCQDTPVITAYVSSEMDGSYCLTPSKYFANPVILGHKGICKNLSIPKMSAFEQYQADYSIMELHHKIRMAEDWYVRCTPPEKIYENRMDYVGA